MLRTRILLSLLVVAASAFLPRHAPAQSLRFHDIPWGTPAREAGARLQAMGYRLVGVDQEGDWYFLTRDGGDLVAMMDSAGLLEISQRWKSSREQAADRFRRAGDSLRAVLGPPGYDRDGYLGWRQGEETLWLANLDPELFGADIVGQTHTGPGRYDETGRRVDAARTRQQADSRDGAWERVGPHRGWMIMLNTDQTAAVGTGVYRTRLRATFNDVLRLDDARKYNERILEMEIDCRTSRVRTLRTYLSYFAGPLAGTEQADAGAQWVQPEPDTLEGRALSDGCVTLARQP